MATMLLTCALGILLGMRHALEPDHLAAVSILSMERPGPRWGLLLGVSWGLGHSLALVAMGGALVGLQMHLPSQFEQAFESAVALMIVALGCRAVFQAARSSRQGAMALHRHGQVVHAHRFEERHIHLRRWTFARRPLLIGLAHGLAGTGALTALVFANLPTTASRVGYIFLFSTGSIIGMAALSGLAGFPLYRWGRNPKTASRLLLAAGLGSILIGAFWGIESTHKLLFG
jgi:ABC-type nickel/cobalt efflux system permease component RcnA